MNEQKASELLKKWAHDFKVPVPPLHWKTNEIGRVAEFSMFTLAYRTVGATYTHESNVITIYRHGANLHSLKHEFIHHLQMTMGKPSEEDWEKDAYHMHFWEMSRIKNWYREEVSPSCLPKNRLKKLLKKLVSA